ARLYFHFLGKVRRRSLRTLFSIDVRHYYSTRASINVYCSVAGFVSVIKNQRIKGRRAGGSGWPAVDYRVLEVRVPRTGRSIGSLRFPCERSSSLSNAISLPIARAAPPR